MFGCSLLTSIIYDGMVIYMLQKTALGFAHKKIIVYGTGINAASFIDKYQEKTNILCCLDKNRRNGNFRGVSIRSWEDIEVGYADVIVIAASDKYISDIYFRIIYNCDRNMLDVFDCHGVNLRDVYRYEYIPYHVRPLIRPDRKELLKKEIDVHGAISFDLFDTLIMRRVMEPEDVFKCVAAKLADDCPIKENFFLLRKECEMKVNAVVQGFEAIYREMERKAGLQVHELDYVAEIEIACEKELLLPRQGMKEIFDYAVDSGKRVNIVSDMYLGADVLEEIIASFGFSGYDGILVSCDYGTSKGEKLFDRYRESVHASSYLHIGDNALADGVNARGHGIDSFLIPSGIDLMRASSMRRALYYAKGNFNRRVLGEFIAQLFQDPFSLCGSGGGVPIEAFSVLGKCFISPIVFIYLKKVKEKIAKEKFDKILLGARDGYLFDKIIKLGLTDMEPSRFEYVYISRVLAFQLGLGHPVVDEDYNKYSKFVDLNDFGKENFDSEMDTPYKSTKENYKVYLSKHGIDLSGKYLFCDLISSGTVQHSIQFMFSRGLEGFYLGRNSFLGERQINATSVFDMGEIPKDQMLIDRLETFISSDEPSVIGMDWQGEFIFAEEQRSENELLILKRIQDEIIEGVHELIEMSAIFDDGLEKKLAYSFLKSLDDLVFIGELSQLKQWIYHASGDEKIKLFP